MVEINNISDSFIEEIKQNFGQKIASIDGVIEFCDIFELALKWNEVAEKYKVKEAKNMGQSLITAINTCDIVRIKDILKKMKKLIKI